MYQIDNSTAATTIPASAPAGPPGYFTDGNPATGVAATILPAEFMNMLMLENINVLTAAGIEPDKNKYNQLSLAISKIVGSSLAWANIKDKPTTLAGYGIIDAYTKTEAGTSFASKATTLAGYGITDAYTSTQTDNRYAGKSTTLAGYGIIDAYTKTEAGTSFASKATTLAGYGITDAYTATQTDNRYAGKATTLAGYGITDAYTKIQVNGLLGGKANNTQATESVAGIAAVATQSQTNAGVDDATIVTPKKMRAGFVSSFTLNGFIAFPTWLGGLVIQWGRTAVMGDGTSITVSLPASFTSTTLQLWTSLYGDVSGDASACRVSSGQFLNLSQIKVSYNETSTALGGSAVTWLCVGF
ncbi:hypothetical protein [Pseudomonas sp.]|uniref:gp53-like domain-containing protein n=1 Tax=Pseudomonas sp. TaxID=306 RepID=UPI00258E216C|nr:hypothetical protein [Pseudomonas sp.]